MFTRGFAISNRRHVADTRKQHSKVVFISTRNIGICGASSSAVNSTALSRQIIKILPLYRHLSCQIYSNSKIGIDLI